MQNVDERLENDSLKVVRWFSNSYLKLDEDKCHFLELGVSPDEPTTITIGNTHLQNSDQETLLGIIVDNKLTLSNMLTGLLCHKASNKLYALSRIVPFLDQNKFRFLMRAFINSSFNIVSLFGSFTVVNYIRKLIEFKREH